LDAQGSVSRWEGIPLGRAGSRRVRYPAGRVSRWDAQGRAGYPAEQGIPLGTLRVSR